MTGAEIVQRVMDVQEAKGVRDFISGATFDALAAEIDLAVDRAIGALVDQKIAAAIEGLADRIQDASGIRP